MRAVRVAVALAAVVSFAPGIAAHAAPKVVCNLLTDPANDVLLRVPVAGQQVPYVDPSIDIRSADVVSDAQGLGVTLRVGAIGATSTSTHTSLGLGTVEYRVFLTLESTGRELIFAVSGWADNALGYAYTASGRTWQYTVGRYLNDSFYTYSDEFYLPYGGVRGVIDPAKSELRLSVPWTDLKKYGYQRAKRDRAVRIRARAWDGWISSNRADPFDPTGAMYESPPRDEASTKGSYTLGAKTCTARA